MSAREPSTSPALMLCRRVVGDAPRSGPGRTENWTTRPAAALYSTPRTLPTSTRPETRRRTYPSTEARSSAKDRLRASPDRPTRINSPAAYGSTPISRVIYGFRPEAAWPGVLMQIILQGDLTLLRKQKKLQFWVSFQQLQTPASFHDLKSDKNLEDLDDQRAIVQCIVPQLPQGSVFPMTLNAYGEGGRSVLPSVHVGYFHVKPNGKRQVPLRANDRRKAGNI